MQIWAPLIALLVACICFGALLASYVVIQLVWPRAETYPVWVRAALGLIVFGLTGYAAFFVAVANVDAFFILKVAYFAAVPAIVIWGAIKGIYGRLEIAFVSGLVLIALFYVALLFSVAPEGDPLAIAANRYSHKLPIDNRLPKILAEQVLGTGVRTPLVGDWLASDRPPLQAGLYMLLKLGACEFGYQVLSMCLQLLALAGIAVLLKATGGLTARVFALTLVAIAISPIFLIFTVFVWPKLLAAAYALIATAFVVGYARGDVGKRLASVGIGLAAGLSFVAHGGTAFFLLGMGLSALLILRTPLIVWIGAVASFVALYLPWFYFQKVIDPPGDRLLKWMLAGQIEPTDKSFGTVLAEAYGAVSFDSWLEGRFENLAKVTGDAGQHMGQLVSTVFSLGESGSSVLSAIRASEFFGFLPAQQLLLGIGGVAIAVAATRLQSWRREYVFLGLTVTLALTVWILLMFEPGSTVNHQGAIATNLLLTALLAIAIGRLDWRILAIVVGVTLWLNFKLYVAKGVEDLSIDWAWSSVAALCIAGLSIAFIVGARSQAPVLEKSGQCG